MPCQLLTRLRDKIHPSGKRQDQDRPVNTSLPTAPATVQKEIIRDSELVNQNTDGSNNDADRERSQIPSAPACDLWCDAFDRLPGKTQQRLSELGLRRGEAGSFKEQIESLREEADKQRVRCSQKNWKVRVGTHEIEVRETAVQIIGWVNKIGDVATQFGPSSSAGPWAVIKSVLQGVEIYDQEKLALLSIIDNVVRIMFCGQIYEFTYTPERTGEAALKRLHQTLVDVYSFTLELLLKSTDLSSHTAVQFLEAIFDPEKPSAMLLELRDRETSLLQAVTLCEATSHANTDARVRAMLEESRCALLSVSQRVEKLLDKVEKGEDERDRQRQEEQEKEMEEVLDWVSSIKHGNYHDGVVERRMRDTGGWLIEHQRFRQWLDLNSSSVLWLRGSPGTGKTFLTSSVIDHIFTRLQASSAIEMEGFGYFYCDQNEEPLRQALQVLRSFVRQLAGPVSATRSVRTRLREAKKASKDRGSDLNLEASHSQLLASFNLYSRSFLIIDALDEMEPRERKILVDELDSLLSKSAGRMKIFISSRPEKDIEYRFRSTPDVQIRAIDNSTDIEKFVTETINQLAEENDAICNLKDTIISELLRRCDGMFQWAALQVVQIAQCGSEDAVQFALDHLPQGLERTYDRILSKIDQLMPPDRSRVLNAIKWVMSASRPLKTDEILAAVRIDIEGSKNFVGRIDQGSLLGFCQNLLVIDSQQDVWRLSHASVAEYFEQYHWSHNEARRHCADSCLLYLIETYNRLAAPSSPQQSYYDDMFALEHPFYKFVEMHWPVYFQKFTVDDPSSPVLKRFLGSPKESSPHLKKWSTHAFAAGQISFPGIPGSFLRKDDIAPIDTPVFVMAYLSLYGPLQDWWQGEDIDLSCVNHEGTSLLAIAASVECIPLFECLLSRGVPLDIPVSDHTYSSALGSAIYHGKIESVRYLAHNVKDCVNKQLPPGFESHSPLSYAVRRGDMTMVKCLLEECNADVDMLLPDHDFGTALATATQGRVDIVQYLVENAGADVNMQIMYGQNGSVLAAATYSRWIVTDVIMYLIEGGHADVNLRLQYGKFGSALAAATHEDLYIVKYLISEGKADVNMQLHGEYGSALAAATHGELDVVKYLVTTANANVDMQLQHGEYGSALAAATHRGLDVVKYLITTGHANVNMQLHHGEYGSALGAAILGLLETVRYLVTETNADVNIRHFSGPYANPLSCAICCGMRECVKILLSAGASADFSWNRGSLLRPLVSPPRLNETRIYEDKPAIEQVLRTSAPEFWNEEALAQIPWTVDFGEAVVGHDSSLMVERH